MAAIKELIQAASIARVTNKAGKLLGFLVKSNSSNEYYQVTCTRIAGEHHFTCTCEAGLRGFANCKKYGHCCHCQAVLEVCEARKELAKKQEIAAKVEENRQAWLNSPWNSPYVSTGNLKQAAVVEAERQLREERAEQKRAAFEAVREQVRTIEAKYRKETFFRSLEEQRAEARKTGGFSILKVA